MYIKKKPDSVESDGIAVKTIKRGWMKGLYKDCIKPELDGTLTLRYRTQYRLSKKYTFFIFPSVVGVVKFYITINVVKGFANRIFPIGCFGAIQASTRKQGC